MHVRESGLRLSCATIVSKIGPALLARKLGETNPTVDGRNPAPIYEVSTIQGDAGFRNHPQYHLPVLHLESMAGMRIGRMVWCFDAFECYVLV